MLADPSSPVCRKPAGGVAAAEIAAVANIREALFDNPQSVELHFADPNAVMKCQLLEDRSSFTEKLESDGRSAKVRHTLRLVADRNLAQAWLDTAFTAELMCRGAVAAITLTDGRRLAIGLSRKFGTEQPLRLKSLTVDSGCKASDEPTVELHLESVDTAFAPQLTT